MNTMKLFNYNQKEIRVITDESGEPRFIAKDVCEQLELSNTSQALSKLDRDDIISNDAVDSLGRKNTFSCVNEAGLYQLVFQSRKKEAQDFKRWIAKEVIPQIRKTGTYSMQQLTPAQLLLSQAQILVEQEKRMDHIEQKVQHLEAKVATSETDYYTISWYCQLTQKKVPMSEANLLGRKCSKLSKELDYKIGKVRDQKYWTINSYHIDILKEIIH